MNLLGKHVESNAVATANEVELRKLEYPDESSSRISRRVGGDQRWV